MMAERLAVSEAKLMKLHHDEVIKDLVEIKTQLAQSRFEALELQVTEFIVLIKRTNHLLHHVACSSALRAPVTCQARAIAVMHQN